MTNDLREFGGLGVQSFQSRLYFGEPIDELFLGLAIFFILLLGGWNKQAGEGLCQASQRVVTFETNRQFGFS